MALAALMFITPRFTVFVADGIEADVDATAAIVEADIAFYRQKKGIKQRNIHPKVYK